MVEKDLSEYEVLLTPQFLDDLESCVEYIDNVLGSPLAAQTMYFAVKEKVTALKTMPQAAVSHISSLSGERRYKISYNKYDIYYVVEKKTVRVLGIKHQLQNSDSAG